MKKFCFIQKEINIPGLKETYRILHVTDVHIAMWDAHDENTVITVGAHKGKKLVSEFGVKRAKHFSVEGVSTADQFTDLCNFLQADGSSFADAVVFTGDILDFYTDAAFEFMLQNLNKLPMPYLFVLGNHDCIFSRHGQSLTLARFATLCGENYKVQTLTLGELSLVGAYNGNYTYDSETLELLSDAIRNQAHVLLFQHVPINSPALEKDYQRLGKHNIVIGSDACPTQSTSKELLMQMIDREDSPVHALICGDSHVDHSGPLTEKITQHVSPLFRDFPPVLFTVKGG
ncbi:MAG: hypothetical protein E7637_07545 [Ruminococcaceae bacterium]|nr:hypothetical protein [Oscillospiraceae bacterium]